MVAVERRLIRSAASFATLLVAACAAAGPVATPVAFDGPLPDDAFERCRVVLLQRFGAVIDSDPTWFRAETGWIAFRGDPPGERRAFLFLEAGRPAVLVESRLLSVGLFTGPQWQAATADADAARDLAIALRNVLVTAVPDPPAVPSPAPAEVVTSR